MPKTEQEIKTEVVSMLEVEQQIASEESELMKVPEFAAFFKRKRETDAEIAAFWKRVEQEMIDNGIKTIKGDWGSLTIAERISWVVTNELPAKFYKKVVDTTKISNTFKLEGKAPKGAVHSYTKFLTKRFK